MSSTYSLKDLMNIGIFVVLYYVAFFIGMCFGYIPILMSVISLITGIICGIPFMLFLTKVKKFGMILLFGIICGLISLAMGSGFLPLMTAVVASLFTELILYLTKYVPCIWYVLAYAVFCLWNIGYGLRLYLTFTPSYRASLIESYGEAYVNKMLQSISIGGFFGSILLCLFGGILGGLLGYAVFKKHFRKISHNV